MERFSKLCVVFCVCLVVSGAFAAQLSLEDCRRMAADGDVEALYQMGVRYETGAGVRKDNLRALANYRKAADKGHAGACRKLADLYESGSIVAKDPVAAAKYRAMAVGESGEAAVSSAKEQMAQEQVDEIEVALDYIIGRNGKSRDAKTGIRLLYSAAKDKPVARRVFVQRWEKGDLDAGLETIGAEEWDMIVPWFKEQFDSGRHLMGGLILGNEARRQKDYHSAIAYYKTAGQAGLAKAWFYLGKLYDPGVDEEDGGGLRSVQSEPGAINAYENCLKLEPNYELASHRLGLIYLFGKSSHNYKKALSIFEKLLKKRPNEMWYLYDYGTAGVLMEEEAFDKKWPNVKAMLSRYDSGSATYRDERNLNRAAEDWRNVKSRCVKYINSIRKAANMGCAPARSFLRDVDK